MQRRRAEWLASSERVTDCGGAGTAADAMEDVFDHSDLKNMYSLKMATSTLRKVEDFAYLSECCIDRFLEFDMEQLTAAPVSEENALAYAVCDHFEDGD